MEKMKSFAACMERLARRNSISNVFSDFLEMSVCALSMGAMEDRYLEIVRRYDKPEAYLMAEAFALMVEEMDNHGEGLKDIFGEFFMEHISHGHNGQFFTPEPICDMIAQVSMGDGEGNTEPGHVPRVLDCACGSGRMLMSAAKINRNARFYGADVDKNCCMMSVINFCLNGMFGEVAWMNSLTNQFYGAWAIRMHPQGFMPYVVKITEEESEIVLRIKEEWENKDQKVVKEVKDFKEDLQQVNQDFFDDILNVRNGEQLTLF